MQTFPGASNTKNGGRDGGEGRGRRGGEEEEEVKEEKEEEKEEKEEEEEEGRKRRRRREEEEKEKKKKRKRRWHPAWYRKLESSIFWKNEDENEPMRTVDLTQNLSKMLKILLKFKKF
ncbi:hypothetical protein STEG23_023932 [Scotinomys teguina]